MPTKKKKCVVAANALNAYQTSSDCAQISRAKQKSPLLSLCAKFQSQSDFRTIKLFENTNLTGALVLFFFAKKKTLVESPPFFRVFGSFVPSFLVLHKGVLDRKKCKKKKGAHTHAHF